MKKTAILAAAAAMVLAACAKIDTVPTGTTPASQKDLAMDFDVYVAQTKAGSAGEMNDAKLKATGFGVIAFEQAGGYDKSIKPNFMYNQEVTYNTSAAKWEYHPRRHGRQRCFVGRCPQGKLLCLRSLLRTRCFRDRRHHGHQPGFHRW